MQEISSMGRGFSVLTALASRASRGLAPSPISEVAKELGRDRSQVSRVIHTLLREHLVRRDDARRGYAPGWEVYGQAQMLTERRLLTDGLTALEGVVSETHESAYLGVLRGDATVTILEHSPRDRRQVGSWVGRPYPAYCSDAGQALLFDASEEEVRSVFSRTRFVRHGPNTSRDLDDFLARLAAARDRGYSIVDEEAEPNLWSVATPVRDFRDEVVAALQIVGPRERLLPQSQACVAAVRRWGEWLSTALCAGAAGQLAPPD